MSTCAGLVPGQERTAPVSDSPLDLRDASTMSTRRPSTSSGPYGYHKTSESKANWKSTYSGPYAYHRASTYQWEASTSQAEYKSELPPMSTQEDLLQDHYQLQAIRRLSSVPNMRDRYADSDQTLKSKSPAEGLISNILCRPVAFDQNSKSNPDSESSTEGSTEGSTAGSEMNRLRRAIHLVAQGWRRVHF